MKVGWGFDNIFCFLGKNLIISSKEGEGEEGFNYSRKIFLQNTSLREGLKKKKKLVENSTKRGGGGGSPQFSTKKKKKKKTHGL